MASSFAKPRRYQALRESNKFYSRRFGFQRAKLTPASGKIISICADRNIVQTYKAIPTGAALRSGCLCGVIHRHGWSLDHQNMVSTEIRHQSANFLPCSAGIRPYPFRLSGGRMQGRIHVGIT
jgi:hypothetical protein